MIKNVLFDLDGTIGNTLPLCIAAFRATIEPLAERTLRDEEIIATFGPSEEGTIAALLPDHQAEGLRRYLASYEALHPEWPAPFDGMLEVLDFLKDNRAFVGLVTGKGEVSATMTLHRYGLDNFFDVVKTGAARGPVKDVRITEVLREYSLQKAETLYVGDVPSDISASRDCGIRIVAAAWAPTAEEEKLRASSPDFLFTSVPEFFVFLKDEFGMK